jgi:hypothetical protein
MSEESSMATELHFNGINAETGEYDFPSMDGKKLTELLYEKEKEEGAPENLSELKAKAQQKQTASFGVIEGIEPDKLEQAGWGIIFAHDADPQIKEALSPLIEWREKTTKGLIQVYDDQRGHRPNESKSNFLKRVGKKGPGPVDPKKVPYYLLIVGDPNRIPYRFQSQLDVQYAVGRIHFESIDEYANYAHSVVKAESGEVKLPRTANFFGVANAGDKATELSSKFLVNPLYKKFKDEHKDWNFSAFMKDEATKGQLCTLFSGDQAPAFLFSASHGMGFSNGSREQFPHQGALLCQDWPGPGQWRGAIPRDFYFSGEDLSDDDNLLGMIAFFFACYGGGTPQLDEFAKQAFKERAQIAPSNFLAQLPTKMLSRPRGGALAVAGHVERAWGYSFVWPGAGAQTEVFESTIKSLLSGKPIGLALEYFNERYAELSTVLVDEIEKIEFNDPYDPYEVAGMWTANNDARGYALLGDPAVRLPVADEGADTLERPVIEVTHVASPSASDNGGVTTQATEAAEQASAEQTPAEQAPARQAETDGSAATEDDSDVPDDVTSYYVDTETQERYPIRSAELYGNWVEYVKQGYEKNDRVFQRVLGAFTRDHNITVAMYVILFLVGVSLFVVAAILAVTEEEVAFKVAALFGGLGVVAFLRYFISRSVQSIEENLEFITWLGMIYNTYWTRLAWTFEERKTQEIVTEATEIAIQQLEQLIDKHAIARGKRYTPKKDDDGGDGQ